MIKKLNHIAIYIPGKYNKEGIIQRIFNEGLLNDHADLSSLQGELYSPIAINHFIDEEIRHDHPDVVSEANHSLCTSSEGEQKKALLKYILSKQPDFIIVDNVFDNLDVAARESILITLRQEASRTLLVQIISRKTDILPFIGSMYAIENNELVPLQDIDNYLAQQQENENFKFDTPIPGPLNRFTPEKDPLIQFNNVSVSYNDRPIVTNISWEINGGEFWQLSGPNGSGKTTLLSLITGDNPKGYGQELYLFGRKKGSGETVWHIKEKTGYFTANMIQQFSRLDSIQQMIISGFFDSVGLYIKPSERQVAIANEWLAIIGMYDSKLKSFRSLSPGRQRLILIIRAMVKHPPLLILDEPTSGLNDHEASLVNMLINKIAAESLTAILYVSHRKETGLTPQFSYQLIPGPKGSTGLVSN